MTALTAEPLRVSRTAMAAIAAHACDDQPRECCGILLGTDDEIIEAVRAANIAEDPQRRYEVSPADHFAQIRRCRGRAAPGGARVVGVYHSHPHGAPIPSPTDLELAFAEYVYLIAGPADGSAPLSIRAYRLADGAFAEIPIEPSA